MKFFFLTIISFSFYSLVAQTYSGQLIDKENGQQVLFANIGIMDKNIGTVSDAAGFFKLELNSKFDQDTLSISCIGYEKRTYLIREFKKEFTDKDDIIIELLPKIYHLEEVSIFSIDTKTYTLGNFCKSTSAYGNAFYSDNLGTEVGVIINLPRRVEKAHIINFRCYVGEFTFNNFPVRLNIYNLKNGKPFENILTKPIYTEITSAGEYLIDLEKYNIYTKEDFFISLEYYRIPDITKGKLVFCAVHNTRMKQGNGYYRLTSQGEWINEMFDNVGFSVQVKCEK